MNYIKIYNKEDKIDDTKITNLLSSHTDNFERLLSCHISTDSIIHASEKVNKKGYYKKRKKYIAPVTTGKVPSDKQIYKHKQKSKQRHKWVIGKHYTLKIKPKDGSEMLFWEYELIKFVYSINDYPMNSLIVKRISGPEEKIYSLGANDCKRLHIKYQPGLEIMSMNTKNLKLKK